MWAFAPVQDRHAAPAIRRALTDLAACSEVEVIVVARGGGSLADLFAFCDETLCRTVALLRVPVISSVGHHTDRTLLDDVAAVACSTPTHAAETAVPVDCGAARAALGSSAARLERLGRRAVVERARVLARLSRAPAHHVERHRTRLHQILRELRAASRRAVAAGERTNGSHAVALSRRSIAASAAGSRAALRAHSDAAALDRTSAAALERRRRDLDRILGTLAAHDPQRTLERGYALLEDPAGEPVTSAEAARSLSSLTVRLHDGRVVVHPEAAAAVDAPCRPAPADAPPPALTAPADAPLPAAHRPADAPPAADASPPIALTAPAGDLRSRRPVRRLPPLRPRPPPGARHLARPTPSRASSATDTPRASTFTTCGCGTRRSIAQPTRTRVVRLVPSRNG